MKRTTLALAVGTSLAIFSGFANAELAASANVALTTDCVWRGISQTDNGPAIQGGFDAELAYTDTDIDDYDLADSRASFTVSKTF